MAQESSVSCVRALLRHSLRCSSRKEQKEGEEEKGKVWTGWLVRSRKLKRVLFFDRVVFSVSFFLFLLFFFPSPPHEKRVERDIRRSSEASRARGRAGGREGGGQATGKDVDAPPVVGFGG